MVLVTTARGITDDAAWPLRDLIANMPGAVEAVSTCPKDAGEACTKDYHCKSGTCVSSARQRLLLFASMPRGVCL